MTLKPGLEVIQGHRNRHVSVRHLWLPVKHGPISYRFQHTRWFQSIAKFSHLRIFGAPADGVPLGIGYGRSKLKN